MPKDDELLDGLKNINFKIHFLTDDFEKICKKKKFKGFFDVASLGFIYTANLKRKEFVQTLKEGGKLYVEKSVYQVPLKKEKHAEVEKSLLEAAEEMNL